VKRDLEMGSVVAQFFLLNPLVHWLQENVTTFSQFTRDAVSSNMRIDQHFYTLCQINTKKTFNLVT